MINYDGIDSNNCSNEQDHSISPVSLQSNCNSIHGTSCKSHFLK